MKSKTIAAGLALAAALVAGPALAADPVKLVDVIELSGPGAPAGTNWKNGTELAVAEINAKGGILGRPIELVHYDSQTNPGSTRAAVQRAIDEEAYVILGPIFSGPIGASMQISQRAEVPQIVGGEAAAFTRQGNPYIFRTSLNQADAMPKLANYLRDEIKAKSVAIVWINNDFGKGGRDSMIPELQKRGIQIAADIATESGQADFAADAIKVKNAGADAVFVYLNEEESARFLRAARQQGIDKPIIGETTLLGAKVVELAGEAANGVKGHVGLLVDERNPRLAEFGKKYRERYGFESDHNGIKGYTAVYTVKTITERVGTFDRQAFAEALHGARIDVAQEPNILLDTKWTDTGDVDRESFLVEIVGGKPVVKATLPMINP
ncbi:ABC transporter substrate-binding protein [Azospirillum sp. ST 5-10]|uniref:ABC transporter substrate-binding protein n=1 Tax=unclassified Azospirillum TaxID=2630922 RepID=UPI003F49E418